MKIQYVCAYITDFIKKYQDEEIKVSTFSNFEDFDNFDINVISFNNKFTWRNYNNTCTKIEVSDDFEHIKKIISDSTNSKVLFICPQNYTFQYDFSSFDKFFNKSILLKDNILNIRNIIYNYEYIPNFLYAKTKTKILNYDVSSDFYFSKNNFKMITKSDTGNKDTTLEITANLFCTLLDLDTFENNTLLKDFIKTYIFKEEKENIPEWVINYNFFNDSKLKEVKILIETEISKKNLELKENTEELEKNNYYKSILFSTGDSLVKVIIKILEEIFEIDLSNFIDIHQEDMLIELDDVAFIIEIKGVSGSVKNQYISQVDLHLQKYKDDNPKKKAKSLLIINPERCKRIEERNEIHQNAINLAIRNETLIITTEIFLKLYEQFRLEIINKNGIKKMLEENKGILTLGN